METNGGTPASGAQEKAQQVVEQGAQVAGTAAEQTMEVASTAADSAKDVASTVAQQAAEVKQEVAVQARTLIDESKTQLHDQAQSQTDKIAESLRKIGGELTALAEGRVNEAGTVVNYARQAADTVQRYAGQVEQRGFDGMVNDVQQFARRRPGTFLLGALAAGFGIGRLLRNAQGAQGQGQQGQGLPGGQFSTPTTRSLASEPSYDAFTPTPSEPSALTHGTVAGMATSEDVGFVPPTVEAARATTLPGSDT
jgi:gas vesicle protein